ncbi:alpha/beta fold hydrolase [Nitrosovibrio tenuis]|uniref:Pimeloyl-ACP methyl ester carboxylesterase n=1 Tax=Nitrosovibrio tenuis TaxID=1233 RepID=A0A1H7JVA5_9PROT|nr:alpha/beta hydrolase [Nitrosovibrio tenuis]SEK78513.1 Pimeloyl-ACP methyl ester carboxylesterase [Nitrosovibrio tenuis]
MEEPELRDKYIAGEAVDLHVIAVGTGPPVVLLHGFPENWRSWRYQIPALVAAGFSVLAPDMRGYNLSGKPAVQSAYQLDHLVADVVALVNATGYCRAHIVGHDWGGIVAWAFAERHPELVDKLVILNAPHMKIYLEKVKYPRQMLKSWYVLFFLLPRLPELALSAGNFRAIRKMFRLSPAKKDAFSSQDIEDHIEALSQPGALTAALNYYRANLTMANARKFAHSAPINSQTLVIWGELDPALGIELLDGLHKIAPRIQIHRVPGASHWVQNEAPMEVNRVLLNFLIGRN